MSNQEKAQLWDELIAENDRLLRENSTFKSDYVGNIPPQIQNRINENEKRISFIVGRMESLFN